MSKYDKLFCDLFIDLFKLRPDPTCFKMMLDDLGLDCFKNEDQVRAIWENCAETIKEGDFLFSGTSGGFGGLGEGAFFKIPHKIAGKLKDQFKNDTYTRYGPPPALGADEWEERELDSNGKVIAVNGRTSKDAGKKRKLQVGDKVKIKCEGRTGVIRALTKDIATVNVDGKALKYRIEDLSLEKTTEI